MAAAAFNARIIPSVAYTDPEVAWVGLTEDQAKAQGIKVKTGLFPWNASGRTIANGRDEAVTKLLFEDSPEAHGHGNILGGGMVGTHAGDMIGEIALAIEMGADAIDFGKTIHPHPTLGESIGMAAEVATRQRGIHLHTDAAQSAGKVPLNVVRAGTPVLSVLHGADQEHGLRPGTENVAAIVALGAAAALANASLETMAVHMLTLRNQLHQALSVGRMTTSDEIHRAAKSLVIAWQKLLTR